LSGSRSLPVAESARLRAYTGRKVLKAFTRSAKISPGPCREAGRKSALFSYLRMPADRNRENAPPATLANVGSAAPRTQARAAPSFLMMEVLSFPYRSAIARRGRTSKNGGRTTRSFPPSCRSHRAVVVGKSSWRRIIRGRRGAPRHASFPRERSDRLPPS